MTDNSTNILLISSNSVWTTTLTNQLPIRINKPVNDHLH